MRKISAFRRRIARRLSPYLFVFTFLNWVYQLLFGTLLGVLFVSLVAYFLVGRFTQIEPLGVPGLLDWFATLPTEAQTAVATGLLTVIGFVAAFWAAFAAWKKQLEIHIRMTVAEDLNTAFTDAQRVANRLSAHLETLQESIAEAIVATSPDDKKLALIWVNSQAEIVANWQRDLYQANQNYYGVIGKNGFVLASVPGGWERYQRVAQILSRAAEHCGAVWWPRSDFNRPDFVDDYLRQVDTKKLQRAIVSCKRVNSECSALIGMLRAQLTSGTIRVRIATVSHMLKRRNEMAKFFRRYLA